MTVALAPCYYDLYLKHRVPKVISYDARMKRVDIS